MFQTVNKHVYHFNSQVVNSMCMNVHVHVHVCMDVCMYMCVVVVRVHACCVGDVHECLPAFVHS